MLTSVECYSSRRLNIDSDIFLIWLSPSHCQGKIAPRLVAWPLPERSIGSHLMWQQPGNCFQTLTLNSAIICQWSRTLHAPAHSEGFFFAGGKERQWLFLFLCSLVILLSSFFSLKELIHSHALACPGVRRQCFSLNSFTVWLLTDSCTNTAPNYMTRLGRAKRKKGN